LKRSIALITLQSGNKALGSLRSQASPHNRLEVDFLAQVALPYVCFINPNTEAYLCSCFLDPRRLANIFRLLLHSLGDTRTCSSRSNQSNVLQRAQSKKGNDSSHAHSPALDFSPRFGGEPFGDESEASFEGVTGI
jgi:hypothetical protein